MSDESWKPGPPDLDEIAKALEAELAEGEDPEAEAEDELDDIDEAELLGKGGGGGIDALMKALFGGGGGGGGGLAGRPVPAPQEAAPAVAAEPEPEPDQALDDAGSTAAFLQWLVAHEFLELEPGATVEGLGRDLAPVLTPLLGEPDTAEIVADWLADRPEVAEIFIRDDDLQALMDRW